MQTPPNLIFMDEELEFPYEIARDWLERNRPRPDSRPQIQLDIPEYPDPPKADESDIIVIQL